MQKQYSPKVIKMIRRFQRDEAAAGIIYENIAKRVKDKGNREILFNIAQDEKEHVLVWRQYNEEIIKPKFFKIFISIFFSYVLGYTFVIKYLENDEYDAIRDYELIIKEIPQAAEIIKNEKEHEAILIKMIDEERLQYIGAMALGLNDALIELTGIITGMTFAFANTRFIALAGIITGASATLSMAASNYLAQRANNNPKALLASLWTGAAYLITVILLVLPYLIFDPDMYIAAFATMIVFAVFIILFFNYYISVVKSLPFTKRFGEMFIISFTVMTLSFLIGLAAKRLLGIE
ncbi:MAG: VIT1/CCC1 family protein [Elusimicrobiota bacterium]|jgi:VIT1/CCC1 family predicted Fe2+/Mn2+ transporter|nr:VIT1/CCC1 family protein [Elusimicrobiota bacterium]